MAMREIFRALFLDNWQRKYLSLLFAMAIWTALHYSLTTTRVIDDVEIRLENLPPGKTVVGAKGASQTLNQRTTLVLMGKKWKLTSLDAREIFVLLDAAGKGERWVAPITKDAIRSKDPGVDLSRAIEGVQEKSLLVELTELVVEKIPVAIAPPVGKAPRGYRFIDVWPQRLWLTVSGPRRVVDALKAQGIQLTFDLDALSSDQIDAVRAATAKRKFPDLVSFPVPAAWKSLTLPLLSPDPLEIDDSQCVQIDFLPDEFCELAAPIPISLYFPSDREGRSKRDVSLFLDHLVDDSMGIYTLADPHYARGVTPLFLETVKGMIELIVVIFGDRRLDWCLQCVDVRALEDRYLRALLADAQERAIADLQPEARREYLRRRFRYYIEGFALFSEGGREFHITPTLKGNHLFLEGSRAFPER